MTDPAVYGLDIETDTSVDGLDPAVSPIVSAALSTTEGDEVFGGPEPDLLAALDARLRALDPGILATWNGAAFDLPFLADRAAIAGVPLGLRLVPDPTVVLSRGPLAGHAGAYRARWYGHRHLDGYRMYRGDVGRILHISCSLKAIARVVGLTPVEVDRERIHELALADLD
ncbi:MAG TPA: 3'-5' exonuclease, partial [Acidimicrobiales bacterium]